jgi:alpha-glucosidase
VPEQKIDTACAGLLEEKKEEMSDNAWSHPHHDGSERYVPNPNPKLAGKVTVLLRVPRASDVGRAWVRVINDGEPEMVRAMVDKQDERGMWLRAELSANGPALWQLADS